MKIGVFFLIAIMLLSSCSSSKRNYKEKPSKKVETQEEKLRRQALERYRLLRLEAMKDPDTFRRYRREKFYQPKVEIKPAPQIEPTVTKIINYAKLRETLDKRKEEREVEIMQNIDFYCIKKQDSSDYTSTKECKEFGMSVLLDCEKEIEDGFYRPDRKLIYCVKNRLAR